MTRTRKTKRLKCIVTGRELILSKDYYQSKLERAGGDEQVLHETYICKEAKDLIKRGYDVDKARGLLGIEDETLPEVDIKIVEQIQNESRIKYRNIPKFNINNYTSAKTDPDVKKFLKRVLK
jgi:hypothetical protein